MLNFYQKERVEISGFEATIMLAGVVVDTNNFTFRCGTRTFEAAANLREYGADMIEIRRLLRNELELQLSLAKYVQLSEIILDNFAVTVVDEKEIITDRTMLAKIAEQLLNIEGMEAAFAIAHISDGVRHGVAISARSYKSVNVQLIMEEMGGGGHLNSAATQIYDVGCSEVKEQLVAILKRDFEIGDEFMKVILLEDVKGRGVKNQVIDVAVGFGNYLISNKKGVLATDDALAKLKEDLHQAQVEAEEQKKMMQKIKEEIEEKCVNIYIKIGADGKLFGHVTTKQIVEEFEIQTGIRLDKRKVSLPVEINALGVYIAVVDLHKEVKANLEINVLEK
jgi:ribosomal protein L9